MAKIDYAWARQILSGEVDDIAFCELKDFALELGIKGKINRLRYNNIKAMMAVHHITNIEMADHIGVHAQTISSWVTNSRQPRLDELYAVAAFLRCDPADLLG